MNQVFLRLWAASRTIFNQFNAAKPQDFHYLWLCSSSDFEAVANAPLCIMSEDALAETQKEIRSEGVSSLLYGGFRVLAIDAKLPETFISLAPAHIYPAQRLLQDVPM